MHGMRPPRDVFDPRARGPRARVKPRRRSIQEANELEQRRWPCARRGERHAVPRLVAASVKTTGADATGRTASTTGAVRRGARRRTVGTLHFARVAAGCHRRRAGRHTGAMSFVRHRNCSRSRSVHGGAGHAGVRRYGDLGKGDSQDAEPGSEASWLTGHGSQRCYADMLRSRRSEGLIGVKRPPDDPGRAFSGPAACRAPY